jgi:hypothetical protein
MKFQLERPPGPFPYRRRKDCWEVVFVIGNRVQKYVACLTEDDAKAVANFRHFQHRYAYPQSYSDVCETTDVNKTIGVLRDYGFGESPGLFQLELLAEGHTGAGE